MTTNYDYVYKKLDEAYLGHEEAKQWVLSNVGEVLNYFDEMRNEVMRLSSELDYCQNSAELEEHRLNRIILELETQLRA